jgi:hypothetical protein
MFSTLIINSIYVELRLTGNPPIIFSVRYCIEHDRLALGLNPFKGKQEYALRALLG